MEIKKIDIEYLKKEGMTSYTIDNIRHIKILPFLSVVQSVEGSYDIALGGGETEQTGKGGFFIAPASVQQTITHHADRDSGRMVCRWIFLDAVVDKQYRLDSLFRFPSVLKGERAEQLSLLFDEMFAAKSLCDEYSCCYKIIGFLLDNAKAAAERMPAAIERAVEYMIANCRRALTVSELAKIATMSEPAFYSAFKRAVGVPPITYLNRYRLSLASERLINTSESIGEIGYSVGIRDALYFSKLFKKIYGVTPQMYRKENQR